MTTIPYPRLLTWDISALDIWLKCYELGSWLEMPRAWNLIFNLVTREMFFAASWRYVHAM